MDDSKKKVLVVEDDEAMRNILVGRLGAFDYQILEAGDGQEAINLILEQTPNLILLDLLLPKLDGFQVLERIRHYPEARIAETKVIVLSNLWSNKDILRAQALKVDEYYVKANTNLDEVLARVEKLLSAT